MEKLYDLKYLFHRLNYQVMLIFCQILFENIYISLHRVFNNNVFSIGLNNVSLCMQILLKIVVIAWANYPDFSGHVSF